MVILNGWAHTSEALRPLAQHLSPSFRVHLAPDIDFPSPHFLVGWSMGGLVALERTAHHPERVSGLILIASTPRFTSADDFPFGTDEKNVRGMTLRLRRHPRETLAQFFRDTAYPAVPGSDELDVKVKSAENLGVDVLCDGLHYLQLSDWRGVANQVHIPTLVLHGEKDRVIPWQAGRWFVDHLSTCRWKLFEESGHDLPIRESHLVADEILRFVSL